MSLQRRFHHSFILSTAGASGKFNIIMVWVQLRGRIKESNLCIMDAKACYSWSLAQNMDAYLQIRYTVGLGVINVTCEFVVLINKKLQMLYEMAQKGAFSED